MKQESFLEEFKRQEKENWRLDPERSYAYLIITPVVDAGKRYYHLNAGLEIKPYSNPLGFGGMWVSSSAKDRDEVERAIEEFHKGLEQWKARGLKRIDVMTSQERVEIRQLQLSG